MGFGAIAAGLHRAPAARAVLAVVEKEPQALIVGAFANPRAIGADQDIRGGPEHGGEYSGRSRFHLDTPSEALVGASEVRARRRLAERTIQPAQIFARGSQLRRG